METLRKFVPFFPVLREILIWGSFLDYLLQFSSGHSYPQRPAQCIVGL